MNLSLYLDPSTRPSDLKLYNPANLTPYKVGQIKTDAKYALKYQEIEQDHDFRKKEFQMKQRKEHKKFKKEQNHILTTEKEKKARPKRLEVLEEEIIEIKRQLNNPATFENIAYHCGRHWTAGKRGPPAKNTLQSRRPNYRRIKLSCTLIQN